jgi:hypothetical protein
VVVKTIKLCKSQPKSDWKVKLTPKTHIQWSYPTLPISMMYHIF